MTDLALNRLGDEEPDILFIHGFCADRLSWLALASQLFGEAIVRAAEYAGRVGLAGAAAGTRRAGRRYRRQLHRFHS